MWMSNLITVKSFKIDVSAYVIGPWLAGVYRQRARGAFNLGVKKSLLKNKLDIYLNANDIFYTQVLYSTAKYQNQDFYSMDRADTQRINFGISYNFGKVKVQPRKYQSSDDERRRMGR
jgi:iron complex outermembrane receptor protein